MSPKPPNLLISRFFWYNSPTISSFRHFLPRGDDAVRGTKTKASPFASHSPPSATVAAEKGAKAKMRETVLVMETKIYSKNRKNRTKNGDGMTRKIPKYIFCHLKILKQIFRFFPDFLRRFSEIYLETFLKMFLKKLPRRPHLPP